MLKKKIYLVCIHQLRVTIYNTFVISIQMYAYIWAFPWMSIRLLYGSTCIFA